MLAWQAAWLRRIACDAFSNAIGGSGDEDNRRALSCQCVRAHGLMLVARTALLGRVAHVGLLGVDMSNI
jgi:hypothetical protein